METLQRRAQAMQDSGEWTEAALAVYDAMLHADPSDEAAAVGRARCLRALGRLREALDCLDQLVARHPENAVARSQAEKTRRRLKARERAEGLLADDATRLFDAAERAKEAERDFDFQIEARRLLSRRDGSVEAACALGAAQRRGRDVEGALNTYRAALATDDSLPSNAMGHVGLAAVLRELGRLTEAEQMLRAVLAVDRRDGFAQITLAATLMDRAEKQGARSRLAEAKRLLDTAYAAGERGKAISSAYGRLRSLA
jgi:tetratricopeptide (TPR) repeat protein